MMLHKLKILPEYFDAVIVGRKCFEIRKNDRGFEVGDFVNLQEYADGQYTGRCAYRKISYITDYQQQPGYVVFGMEKLPE